MKCIFCENSKCHYFVFVMLINYLNCNLVHTVTICKIVANENECWNVDICAVVFVLYVNGHNWWGEQTKSDRLLAKDQTSSETCRTESLTKKTSVTVADAHSKLFTYIGVVKQTTMRMHLLALHVEIYLRIIKMTCKNCEFSIESFS